MSKQKESAELNRRKKIIDRSCAKLLDEMSNSKTDLQRVHVLNQMDDLLQDEIDHWLNFIAQETEKDAVDLEDTLNEASIQIDGLKRTQDKINPMRKALLPGALELQDHLDRNGTLKYPKLGIDGKTQSNG